MKYLANSTLSHIRKQVEKHLSGRAGGGKLIFAVPELPGRATCLLGAGLEGYAIESGSQVALRFRVAREMIDKWVASGEEAEQRAANEAKSKGWTGANGTLTAARNEPAQAGAKVTVIVLVGTGEVTDSASLADFHRCGPETVWTDEMAGSFESWAKMALNEAHVGFEPETIEHFDRVLLPLREKSLADLSSISLFLEETLTTCGAQTGRDAERVLLDSFGFFGLPRFGGFEFRANNKFSGYVDDALKFFRYSLYVDEGNRKKDVAAVSRFRNGNADRLDKGNGIFSDEVRAGFSSDAKFLDGIEKYIETGDDALKSRLISCDFVAIRDKVLKYKEKGEKLKHDKTVALSGSPIEVVLRAVWLTLGDFLSEDMDETWGGRLEALGKVRVESVFFKHDCDGANQDQRRENAIVYLGQLLGGVDEWLAKYAEFPKRDAEGNRARLESLLILDDKERLDCKFTATAEPRLEFVVTVLDPNGKECVHRRFAWKLPEIQPYRIAHDLVAWAHGRIAQQLEYVLPVFHFPHYDELMLAKDDEETLRILLLCVQADDNKVFNLLAADEAAVHYGPMLECLKKLAVNYCAFLKKACEHGLHAALLDGSWDELRKAYEAACEAYIGDEANNATDSKSPFAPMLFRAFLGIRERSGFRGTTWAWEPHEQSAVVTVLHPALLEMLKAQVQFFLTCFNSLAARALSEGQNLGDDAWEWLVDLATIQMPVSGLIRDENLILDTNMRGRDLVHRIGRTPEGEATLTTRLLLRGDGDEDEIATAELFGETRESRLIRHILNEYADVHPHANDGLSVAVFMNDDIQPVIAAVDSFLRERLKGGSTPLEILYAMSLTVFSESGDDTSVARWIEEWRERWDEAEAGSSNLAHYRLCRLSVAHRIVSDEKDYKQFRELIRSGLEIDVAILQNFVGAGSDGNEFELVSPLDVRTRTIKFPILEKAFCASDEPGKRLRRARVVSNRQFRLTSRHAEVMARLKNRETLPGSRHVVLGDGDFTPWKGVVDALHRQAEWVVCIDPSVDERLIAVPADPQGNPAPPKREIIGFGSGVGSHGESNYTISTEQMTLSDVRVRLKAAIRQVYDGWGEDVNERVTVRVMAEALQLSGLSLVRATGVGEYIRDFMAYSLVRCILTAEGDDILCSQLVSLDAYAHWFDGAESKIRPDLLWLVARLEAGEQPRMHLETRFVECKLGRKCESHLDKALEQLTNALKWLVPAFMPRQGDSPEQEDQRPDARYWWLQLHRLVASKARIDRHHCKQAVLDALERLAEGDFDISWQAAAQAFWTDDSKATRDHIRTWEVEAGDAKIPVYVFTAGSGFLPVLCADQEAAALGSWDMPSVKFRAMGGAKPESDKATVFPEDMEMLPDDLSHEESDEDYGPDDEDGNNDKDRGVGHDPSAGTGGSRNQAASPSPAGTEQPAPSIPKRILLGSTTQGNRQVFWEYGHRDLQNRHMLIFGTSGMGKTYAIQCLLTELAQNGSNSVIVDYTRGFADNQLEAAFKGSIGPVQHLVRMVPFGINPFRQQVENIGGVFIKETPAHTALRVAGILDSVYAFGDQQRSAVYDAVKHGIENHGYENMSLERLAEELAALRDNSGPTAANAATALSRITPFIDLKPFGKDDPKGWDRFFTTTDSRCHVIQLAGLPQIPQHLVTEFALVDAYSFYRGRGTEDKPRVVVLDEIQNLDHKDGGPLACLLTEGRKFGFSLILATQMMSNLDKDERDRLFQAGHKLFFRPADTDMGSYADIASTLTDEKAQVWRRKLADLGKGECYSIGPACDDNSNKLATKPFRIRIASLEERGFHS